MFALVSAMATWGHLLHRKRVLIHCDNLVVVNVISSGKSKDGELMSLLRALFFICATHDFECNAIHVPGVENNIADALSRMKMDIFHKLVPDADPVPTMPVSFQVDF